MRALLAVLAGSVLVLSTTPVLAHDSGMHAGLLAGFAHPLGGLDHLLATFGIGLVAGITALRPRGADLAAPGWDGLAGRTALAAAAGLAAGAAAGAVPALVGWLGGAVEHAAALGLLALAIAIALAPRLGPAGSAVLALAVLLPHGMLHATEGSGAGFFAGLAVASLGLYGLGHLAGRVMRTSQLANPVRWAVSASYAGACVLLLAT
jgi:urease accessory protein